MKTEERQSSQTFSLDLSSSHSAKVHNNHLIANAAVATSLTSIIRTRGCQVLNVTGNTSKGDTSSIPFHSHTAAHNSVSATNHYFHSNQSESGYYRSTTPQQASEFALPH